MNKKLLFFACLIILISTVSFAAAADDMNQTIGNGADTGTFGELEEKITTAENQSVISLDKDYVYDGETGGQGINITKDITINGNGYVIDANHATGIFNINSANVVLKNIVFANAFSSVDGGAIKGNFMDDDYRYCSLEISNCSFINNTAYSGGAIFTFLENIKISNCSFINNTASYEGGAIWLGDTYTLIDNSIFLNNSAPEGAALYFLHDMVFWSNSTISNSVFNDNRANVSNLWIGDTLDCGYCDVHLLSKDNLADNQIKLYCIYDFYMDMPIPDIYFSNVSYNGFKNQSFKVEESDLKHNTNNAEVRFEVYDGDVCLINTTIITHDGIARFDLGNLTVGNTYYLKAYYGNRADSKTIIGKKDLNFTMSVDDIVFGEDLIIDFNISTEIENYGNTNGSFEIWAADENGNKLSDIPEQYGDFNFADSNITIRFYHQGTFIAFLDFKGDGIFYPKRISQTFNVIYNRTGNYTIINVEPFEESFGEHKMLYFNLTDENGTALANREIQITINGVDYTKTTDSSGKGSMAINLGSGFYPAVFFFKGDDDYLPTSSFMTLYIFTTVYCGDMEKYVGDPGRFTVTCTASHRYLTEGEVEFNINGVIYHRNINENGEAGLNINLSPGEYIITAKNPVTGEMRSAVITVLPKIVNNHDLVKYYRNDSQFTVQLDGYGDLTGQTVTFNINGVLYERITDENGIAKLNINLSPGQYIITAMYGGCMVSNNITVLPVLAAENMQMSYLDGSTFNATIVDGQGNPLKCVNITFNINGVFYQRTTDDNGTARLNIRLMAGEYIITSLYGNAVISNKITISS